MSSILKITAPIFFVILLFCDTTHAKENYSAADCVRRSGGSPVYGFDGSIGNNSTASTMFVLCHVPHTDFDGLLHNGGIENGWVHTVDLNNGADIHCRFRRETVNANGSVSTGASAMRSTVGFGTNRQVLNLTSLSESSTSAYVLACEIPPRTANGTSRVITYSVSQ